MNMLTMALALAFGKGELKVEFVGTPNLHRDSISFVRLNLRNHDSIPLQVCTFLESGIEGFESGRNCADGLCVQIDTLVIEWGGKRRFIVSVQG